MTESDLQEIEHELGVKLPICYRSLMREYDIPGCNGNTDELIVDNPAELIRANRIFQARIGATGASAPESCMFVIGYLACVDLVLIDLSEPDGPVYLCEEGEAPQIYKSTLDALAIELRNNAMEVGPNPARAGCVQMIWLLAIGFVLTAIAAVVLSLIVGWPVP